MYNGINELSFKKNEYTYCVAVHVLTIGMCIGLAVRFTPPFFLSLKTGGSENIVNFFVIIILLVVIKLSFTELVSILRFYGSSMKIENDSLIIYTDRKKCEIPLNKDVNVMFCMMGWLIMWRSENSDKALLIRNILLGSRYLKLEPSFKLKTNYIISSKEKKEVLKDFQISRVRPLKYIKWPDEN